MKRITEYVLLRHFSLYKENIIQFVDQLDFSLLHGVGGCNCMFILLSLFSSFMSCYKNGCYIVISIVVLLTFSKNKNMICFRPYIIFWKYTSSI